MEKTKGLYGLIAEFDTPTEVVNAAHKAYEAGYRKMDAYTPFPIEELNEALHLKRSKVPLIVLIGGIVGALGGYILQYWASNITYPINIGGRPMHTWPMFIVITFECTILVASFSAVLGMLALNGLPQPYHPVFNSPRFELASRTNFFLCIESADPKFDVAETREFLEHLSPAHVSEVEY
jgi:hypothetical protein